MPKDVNAAVATIKTKRTIQFVDSGLHLRISLNPRVAQTEVGPQRQTGCLDLDPCLASRASQVSLVASV